MKSNCHSGFNLLIDYYPDEECIAYGTGLDETRMAAHLQALAPAALIVYAKGHGGWTTYPSRLDTAHPRLARDTLAFYRDLTRKLDIKLIIYVSGLINGLAAARHPDWTCESEQGRKTYDGLTNFEGRPKSIVCICPTSPYFEKFMAPLLEEIVGRYDPDGVWFDGDWGGNFCYCRRCRALFEQWLGRSPVTLPPMTDEDSELGRAWQDWSLRTHHEWRRKCAEKIRALKPGCLYSSGNLSLSAALPDPMDYHSGDWFSPNNHRLTLSMALRYYNAFGKPAEAMTCDTQYCKNTPALFRSAGKSLDRMMQEGATVLANGGQWVYWTYPQADGALIPSRLRVAQQAKAKIYTPCRDIWDDTASAAEWAVVVVKPRASLTWRAIPSAAPFRALIQCHRSPDFLEMRQLRERSAAYPLILAADEAHFAEADTAWLYERIVAGAVLVACGRTVLSPGMEELLGVKVKTSETDPEGFVFTSAGAPAGIPAPWMRVEPTAAEVRYPLYRPWGWDDDAVRRLAVNYPLIGRVDEDHPEPAGYPAVTWRTIGQGRAVYVAANPFVPYYLYGYPELLQWLRELIAWADPEPLVKSDAPSWVELVFRKRADALLIHAVNGNPGRDLSAVGVSDLFVDEIPEVGPYHLEVRNTGDFKQAFWHPAGKRTPVPPPQAGRSALSLPRFHIHVCCELRPARDER